MIVNGMNGYDAYSKIWDTAIHWGNVDQVSTVLEDQWNKIWYGLPENIPVMSPGAPQTKEEMTNWTPEESIVRGWSNYQADSKKFFDQIPNDAGAGGDLVMWGVLIGVGLLTYLFVKGR